VSTEPGQTLSHYRLIEKIGEGGMGIVWKALDTTLDREVAIKVLPELLSKQPDRLARFEREAKMLAALNHPGIAAVHSVHEAGGIHFLSMELVPGEDMRERLDRGVLPIEEALEIARQIAEALEAAHERGVVHRDLKPANVKLTPEGRAKVLDLGLAKAMSLDASASGDVDPALSPTITSAGSVAGILVGTAAYMSPEQARGKPVDRRTDIWSFGVLLYEMLVGRNLFGGETVSDILAGVLKTDPDWATLPSRTPAAVRRMLARCMTRNPAHRLQAIGDARVILEEVLADPSSWVETATGAPGRMMRALAWAILPVALIAFAAGWFLRPSTPPSEPSTLRAEIGLPAGQSLVHVHRHGVALSPDGRLLAFVGGTERPPQHFLPPEERPGIWVRPLDQGQARLLVERGMQPVFSPDGEWIAFVSEAGIQKIPVAGGDAVTLANDEDIGNFGLTWVGNDTIVFAGETGPLYRIPAGGGEPTAVTALDEDAHETNHRLPHALPDGKTILFTSLGANSSGLKMEGFSTHVVSLDSGERKRILDNSADARYVESDHLVFAREGVIMAAPFDPQRLEVTGPEVRAIEGVMQSLYCGNPNSSTAAAQFAVSETGLLAYVAGQVCPDTPRPLVWVDRDGEEQSVGAPDDGYLSMRVSPDGRMLLLTVPYPPHPAVWTYDLERKTLRKQTFDQAVTFAVWGPGPDRITYDALDDAERRLFTRPLDAGPGAEEPFGDLVGLEPGSWDLAGERFVGLIRLEDGRARIVGCTRDGKFREIVESPFDLGFPKLSPDGRMLAYMSAESGRSEIYVRPYDAEGRAVQVSTNAGISPVWSADGRELFFRRWWDYSFHAASVSFDGAAISVGQTELLFGGADLYGGSGPTGSWSVAPDGRFLMRRRPGDEVRRRVAEALFPERIQLVQGWFGELEAKAP
jgi:serine/threonine-protein kinase